MGLGPRPVRGRRGRGRTSILSGRVTDRVILLPQAGQQENLHFCNGGDGCDGGDGSAHISKDLVDKIEGARTKASQPLVA